MENFHGFIALPLELMVRENQEVFKNETITADDIETGRFVEVMLKIIAANDLSEQNFTSKCTPYMGKCASDIGYENARELFYEFKRILDDKE